MKFSLLLLPLLLPTNCLINVSSLNISNFKHENKSLSDEFEAKSMDKIRAKNFANSNLNFLELNQDVLHLIIEELNFIDLLNAAKVNQNLAFITTNVFHRRYLNYTVEIIRDDVDEREKCGILPLEKRLKIYDYELSLNLLRYFMCVIQKLVIKNELLESGHSTIISRLVNEYSTQHMTSLKLGSLQEDTLAQFTAPFEAVEDFECTIKVKNIEAKILPFIELFPRLRQLNLRLQFGVDFSYIDCELPHLEYLDIFVFNDAWKQNASIEGLIRKNPQIKCLVSYGFPSNYAKVLNKLLPHLEKLTLHGLDIGNETLRFENVKHFTSVVASPISIEQLSFPRLESLTFHYWTSFLNAWISFLERHQHLTKLHVNEFHFTGRVQLVELTNGLNNLVEMSMECCSFISAEDLTNFIENHPKLMKFEFSVLDFKNNPSVIRNIRERFGNEWNVTEFNGDQYGLALERKVLMA